MLVAHVLVFLFDAIFPPFRPLELRGENRQAGRDYQERGSRKHQQRDAGEQDDSAHDTDQNLFGMRFQSRAICPIETRTPRVRGLIRG